MSRRTTLPAPWLPLVAAAGGVGALAEALGVAPATLRSWGAGTVPGRHTRAAVSAWARRRGLEGPWRPAPPRSEPA